MDYIQFILVLLFLPLGETLICGTSSLRATDDVKLLTSPGFPHNYTNNLDCKWVITSSTGYNIQLIVQYSNIEDKGCQYDAVEVYDGINTNALLIGRFCGRQQPSFVSLKHAITVTFTTDADAVGRGFTMSFQSGHFGACGHRAVTSETLSAVITSPLYPMEYPNNADCTWTIQTSSSQYIVYIKVTDLHLDYDSSCSADYLQAFDDPFESSRSLGKWCGSSSPLPVHSSGQYMFIKFISNDNVRNKGFRLEYRSSLRSYYFDTTRYSNTGAMPGGISTSLVFLGVILFAVVYRARRGRKLRRSGQTNQIRLASILESTQQRIYTIGGDNSTPAINPATFAPPPSYDVVMATGENPRAETPPPSYNSLGSMFDTNTASRTTGVGHSEEIVDERSALDPDVSPAEEHIRGTTSDIHFTTPGARVGNSEGIGDEFSVVRPDMTPTNIDAVPNISTFRCVSPVRKYGAISKEGSVVWPDVTPLGSQYRSEQDQGDESRNGPPNTTP